ncbi:MAG TPA: hypothetical protein VJ010_08425, partial [Actinomycetota bacterium]|nr:hypothetical protein [Actinomycetota bacterium]
HLGAAEGVAQPLALMGVVHGSEAVGEGDVADALLVQLALAPLVPVAPLRGDTDYVADVRFVRATSYFVGH